MRSVARYPFWLSHPEVKMPTKRSAFCFYKALCLRHSLRAPLTRCSHSSFRLNLLAKDRLPAKDGAGDFGIGDLLRFADGDQLVEIPVEHDKSRMLG